MSPTRKKPDDLRDAGGGQTKTQQGGESKPRLPHEHDESSDSQESQGGEPTEVGKQAHEDVERGLVDTDRGLEADSVYREKVKR
ncbi:MAG TPA: hypothetical protein VEP93_10320 [Variovorax sp.]|nr:hypothetical protein [Variovorax sp.]